MSEPIAPAPTTLIPKPTSWSNARSFRSISGMSNDEKFNLQTYLRELCDTYLDPTKLWPDQSEKLRDQIVEKACAQYPYVGERYEGAWPIEAWLRSRLSSSKSTWRRKSEQPSRKPRPKPKAKAKTVTGTEEPNEDAPIEGQGTQDTKDDMDIEVDELAEDDEAAPMEIAPSEADPFEGSSQDVNQALAEICSMGLSPITTSPASSDATRIVLRSSPAPQNLPPPPKQTAKRTPARKPRIPAPSASQPSTSTPRRTAVAKKPRLPASTKKSAQKALETPSGQMNEPTPSQGTDAKVVRRFLEGLAQPLPNLLPRFIAHGVSTASSLRALTVIGDKELDGLLREDLKLNSFETRIVRDGLERLVK